MESICLPNRGNSDILCCAAAVTGPCFTTADELVYL